MFKSLPRRGASRRAPPRVFASFGGAIAHPRNGPRTSASQRSPLPPTQLEIASRWPVLGAAQACLAVDERRGDSAEAASHRPFIGVGTPDFDHGVGWMALGQQPAR